MWFAGCNGVNLITYEAFHKTGVPDDDYLIDEWIENGGTFQQKGKGKRGGRPDRESQTNKKSASKTGQKANAKGGSAEKGASKKKSTSKTKKSKEAKKKKKAKLLKQLELMSSDSSSDESDSGDKTVTPKRKGLVEAACEEVRKENEEDSDDDTVGIEEV